MTRLTLAPDEKWHIEVDANLLNELRLAMGWSWTELSEKSGATRETVWEARHKGTCQFKTLAKIATALQVQPGELIIWFPVPKDYQDGGLGWGRKPVKRRRDYMKPPKAHKHWSDADKETLLSLRAAGYYWREIAARLGRGYESVKSQWYTLTKEDRSKEDGKENSQD